MLCQLASCNQTSPPIVISCSLTVSRTANDQVTIIVTIIIIIIVIIIIIIIIIVIIIIIIELTHSKATLENTVEIEPLPVALDFKNLSQYSSHFK